MSIPLTCSTAPATYPRRSAAPGQSSCPGLCPRHRPRAQYLTPLPNRVKPLRNDPRGFQDSEKSSATVLPRNLTKSSSNEGIAPLGVARSWVLQIRQPGGGVHSVLRGGPRALALVPQREVWPS